jgi:hypothetical protein
MLTMTQESFHVGDPSREHLSYSYWGWRRVSGHVRGSEAADELADSTNGADDAGSLQLVDEDTCLEENSQFETETMSEVNSKDCIVPVENSSQFNEESVQSRGTSTQVEGLRDASGHVLDSESVVVDSGSDNDVVSVETFNEILATIRSSGAAEAVVDLCESAGGVNNPDEECSVRFDKSSFDESWVTAADGANFLPAPTFGEAEDVDSLVDSVQSNCIDANLVKSTSEEDAFAALAVEVDNSQSVVRGIGQQARSDQIQYYNEMEATCTDCHVTQDASLRMDQEYAEGQNAEISEDFATQPDVTPEDDDVLRPSGEEDVANALDNRLLDEAFLSSSRETIDRPTASDALEIHHSVASAKLRRSFEENEIPGGISGQGNIVAELRLGGESLSSLVAQRFAKSNEEREENEDACMLTRCPSCERDRSVVMFPRFPHAATVQLALLDYSKRKMVSLGTGFVFSAEHGLIGSCGHLIFDMSTRQPKVLRPPLYVLVGVSDNDGDTAAVFRFIAVVERDEDIFRTDVCFVKIRSRLEFDVRTEQEAYNILTNVECLQRY